MNDRFDCVVIGAGVIGLCIARRLAMSGREVIVLEASEAIGTHTSSRNSGIIHAGLYYRAGSLKASCCVAGKDALYAYCAAHGVEHRRCGKLIVASNKDQLSRLKHLQNQALANGVLDVQWRTAEEVKAMEPEVVCHAALWSPSTGIINSHELMLALQADAEASGAVFAFRSPMLEGRIEGQGLALSVGEGQAPDLHAAWVVNAAGLSAHTVAACLHGLEKRFIPPIYYAKGNYFSISGKPPFSRPVYPLPEKAGLGIHATVDLGGQVLFGPDVEWVDEIDYAFDPGRADRFYEAIRTYYPALADGSLHAAYSGIRPKLQGPGDPVRDFVIQDETTHGVKGLVNLFGIESPGLTASLAIADRVAAMLA